MGAAHGIASSSRAQHDAQAAQREARPAAANAEPLQQQQERTCWQCGTRLASHDIFFCPDCESVQPASPEADYFPVFGM
jgi:predicted amidophosphoribosyltransferase